MLDSTYYHDPPRTAVHTVTLAELNAGKTLVDGKTGRKLVVTDFSMLMDGTFLTTTSIDLESDNSTPVAIASLAVAGATDGSYIAPDHANITLGAGFGAVLGSGDGIQLTVTGADATGGTSILVIVEYLEEAG